MIVQCVCMCEAHFSCGDPQYEIFTIQLLIRIGIVGPVSSPVQFLY